jgi:DNA-binding PadR family transcriptional regulator
MVAKKKVDPQSFLPVKPVDLEVLMVLLDGDLHGYGLVQEIAERTGGRIRLVPGNFYSVLKRLMDTGLLREAGEKPSHDPGKPARRLYRITPRGKHVVIAETQRLQGIVRYAESKRLILPSDA